MLVKTLSFSADGKPLSIDKAIVVVFRDMESDDYRGWMYELLSSGIPELANWASRMTRYPDTQRGYRQVYIETNFTMCKDSDDIDPRRYYREGAWLYATPQEVLDYFVGYNRY